MFAVACCLWWYSLRGYVSSPGDVLREFLLLFLLRYLLLFSHDWMNKSSTTLLHPFNGPLSGTTQVSRHQKGKANLDFTEARESEWQWHQLGRMQVCTSLQTDNHASTPPLNSLQAGCPSYRPTNSVRALKSSTNPQQMEVIWSWSNTIMP